MSAVFNAMVIPAMCIFAVFFVLKKKNFSISKKVVLRDGLVLIGSEALLIWMIECGTLQWYHGAALIAVYVCYMVLLLSQHIKSKKDPTWAIGMTCGEAMDGIEDDITDDEDDYCWITKFFIGARKISTFSAILLLAGSVLWITAACYIMAENVIDIAGILNINTFFVAVILAAAATSVPDTIISMKDAAKGNYDDSVSNAIGSNIFDITVCFGLPLMLWTLIYGSPLVLANSAGIAELRILLLILTVLVIAALLIPKKVTIYTGVLLASGYVFYALFTMCRGFGVEWAVQFGKMLTFN